MMSGSRRAALPPKGAPPPWELFWGHRPVQARGQGCPVEGDHCHLHCHHRPSERTPATHWDPPTRSNSPRQTQAKTPRETGLSQGSAL